MIIIKLKIKEYSLIVQVLYVISILIYIIYNNIILYIIIYDFA